ncbi:MAG: protein kinase [Anaerolineae bacterium]|nr:protein kinase [Anaerolineae bacterium]
MEEQEKEKELLNQRYQLEELLGKGGMARVYRARDLMLERDVAVKILREDYSTDPDFRERFRQEAKAAANLSHANIVTVHDFGLDENRLFIIMEHVPGKDLNSIIKEVSRFKVEEGIGLIIQACAGIGYAHRAGLVHCDIKPHNFLVTRDQRLKVTDFGIARALASINPEEENDVVWGSPQYFSPEQASGSAPSPASDVYSLGVVMYLMFTGQLPYIANSSSDLARQHRLATPIPPRELNPFIPPALEDIINKVLSKEPSARYRTADQLGRVLLTFSNNAFLYNTGPQNVSSEETTQIVEFPPAGPASTPLSSWKQNLKMDAEDTGELPQFDWVAVGLGLLALISVGGLVPLWIWVFFVFNPPLR